MLYSNMSIRTVAEPSLALRVRLSQRERFAARCFEQAPETGQERSMPVGQSIEQESAICLQSVMDAFTDALLSQERFFSPVGRRQAAKQARPDFRRRRGTARQPGQAKRTRETIRGQGEFTGNPSRRGFLPLSPVGETHARGAEVRASCRLRVRCGSRETSGPADGALRPGRFRPGYPCLA